MKYLLSLLITSTLIFGVEYQSETVIMEDTEYIFEDVYFNIDYTEDNFEENIPTEHIDFQEILEPIQYLSYKKAEEEAISEEKFLLVKIESNNCKSCDKLNSLLYTNHELNSLISSYTKAVKLNRDADTIPSTLNFIGTPTIFLLNAKTGRVLMKLQGNEASDELEESLKSILWE